MDARHVGQQTVLFVVSEDWYFVSHRLPQARAVRDMGFRVVVAARVHEHRDEIVREGFEVINVPFERRSLDPVREARVIWALRRVIRAHRPSVIHAVALKPIIDVGFAALLTQRATVINAFTGMGAVLGHFARPSPLKRFIASLIRSLSRLNRAYAIVQNSYDEAFMVGRGIAPRDRVFLVPGSGVDVDAFQALPEPQGPVVISMVSRLLKDKGVGELVVAGKLLRERGVAVKIQIVGTVDPENPHSVTAAEIAAWQQDPGIAFLGRHDDVAAIWAMSHIAVLPSYYGEGVPKSLLEAAACGRPIVTTEMPGCRDLVPDDTTGILVPPRDPRALADALARLAERPDERADMGRQARELAVRKFSDARVMERTQEVYRAALGYAQETGQGGSYGPRAVQGQ